jgi:hypothetical protein
MELIVARDCEEFAVQSNDCNWVIAWHPPPAPDGLAHGANALCMTADRQIVLISGDGAMPGRNRTGKNARPENHFATTIAGGFQLPSPGGRIEGGCVFGQYKRITR